MCTCYLFAPVPQKGERALPPPQRGQGQGISPERGDQSQEADSVRGAHRPTPALRATEADAHCSGSRRGATAAGDTLLNRAYLQSSSLLVSVYRRVVVYKPPRLKAHDA